MREEGWDILYTMEHQNLDILQHDLYYWHYKDENNIQYIPGPKIKQFLEE